jgi:hypothetical protein
MFKNPHQEGPLADALACAAAAFLDAMGTGCALVPLRDSHAGKYVVAGTLQMISKVAPAGSSASVAALPTDRFTYSVDPRDEQLGGGWRLKLLENGEEVGGGVFPVTPDATADDAYVEAADAGDAWLQSRPATDATIAPTEDQVKDEQKKFEAAIRATFGFSDRDFEKDEKGYKWGATIDMWHGWSAYADLHLQDGLYQGATQIMLDILGRLHPYEQPHHGDEAKRRAYERLERAFVIQQPWPIPDQAAIVWRGDLMDMRYALVHRQAVFESWKRERADQSPAVRDVLAERRRQIEVEKWTPEHDSEHSDYSLAQAAAAYAFGATVDEAKRAVMDEFGPGGMTAEIRQVWPNSWAIGWFKPKSRRADLVKAGALILAEIERLDRAALYASQSTVGDGGAA